jgi:allantoinase
VFPKAICDRPCPHSRYETVSSVRSPKLALHIKESAQDTGSVLLFHAEVDDDDHPTPIGDSEDPTVYDTFLKSRPESFEVDAISRIVALQQQECPTLRCHIVHLSAAHALPIIRRAKAAAGHKLTVETCFHYLCLASDSIPDARPEFKCCPPIRDAANCEALWAALLDGTIDCVVSDHSPCVAELKKLEQGDVMGAWGGISTLGFGLSLLWTEGRKRNVPIGTILGWVSEKTASHAGLGDRKGKIAVGYDADLVIWDPDVQYAVRNFLFRIISMAIDCGNQVTKETIQFKNKVTPYEGLVLSGRVEQTILRGHPIYNGTSDTFHGLVPSGLLL